MLLWTMANFIRLTVGSGQQLRQDDPSALKDIIEIVQGKVSIEGGGVKWVPFAFYIYTSRPTHVYQRQALARGLCLKLLQTWKTISRKEMSHKIKEEQL